MDDNHFNSLFLILFITLWLCISCSVSAINNCSFTEREALIAFKQSLKDPSYRLSSWGVGLNCCHWHGITCDFVSGKVTEIDLRNSMPYNQYKENSCLGGEISPSLLHLKYLNYLDLSLNNFEGAPIPYFFGMLKNLRYLNLSYAYFSGEIPHHLGNLSRLNYLDLSGPNQYGLYGLRAESLNWLSGLSSLQYLDLGLADLALRSFFLTHLNLSFNNLTGRVPTSIQLQTLEDPSIYEGNPSLCGSAIQIKCPGDEDANNNTLPIWEREGQAKENSSLMFGFYMSMAIGFPVGLNILFFTILVKKSWRASYFGFIDRVNYNILDIFVLIEICIRRRTRRWTKN